MVGGVEPITRIAPQGPVGSSVAEQTAVNRNVPKNEPAEKKTADLDGQKQSASERLEEESTQLEDVVAVSEFGDTVQVSEDGREQQEQQMEGSVIPREDGAAISQAALAQAERGSGKTAETDLEGKRPAEINFEVEEPESEEQKAEQETESADASAGAESLTAYPKARLEQMYLNGDISQYDYEAELERRAQIEEASETRNERLADSLGKAEQDLRAAGRMQASISKAFSDQASTTVDPKLRLDAMENLDLMSYDRQQRDLRQEQQLQVHFGS